MKVHGMGCPPNLMALLGFVATLLLWVPSIARAQDDSDLTASSEVSPAAAASTELLLPIDQRYAPGQSTYPTPDFQRHVVPLFGRMGCNGRGCHGSFQGQGGFRLSLFGYDFAADHAALLDADSPRIDLEQIEQSLILVKPTDESQHEGGERFKADGWEATVLRSWLEAQGPTRETPWRLERLEVEPREIQFTQADQTAQLQVIAVWEDGTREDVTPLCRFRSNDDAIALITEQGLVTAATAGDTHVVVFYDKAVVPIPVLRPVSPQFGSAYPEVPTTTEIDRLVVEKLRKLGIIPSDAADDTTFLRRVSLDLTGTLPTPAEVLQFVADTDPDKRSAKVEELLQTPAYAAWWTTILCDITGNNSTQLNNTLPLRDQPTQDWYNWIYQRVEDNVPYDQIVAGIVTARSMREGQTYTQYAEEMCAIYRGEGEMQYADLPSMTHYWTRRDFRDSEDRAIHFAYAFMGIRVQCAQCHKHPFDQWSQADFQAFSKFFEPVVFDNSGRATAPEEFQQMVESLGVEAERGNQLRQEFGKLLRDGKTVPIPVVSVRQTTERRRRQNGSARTPGEYNLLGIESFEVERGSDPRESLMEWLRREDNPYFASAMVNRVWAVYFGRGIVHPADDLSLANPPSNAPLLDYLSQGFIQSGYDLKWLHREIINSRTYQADWRPNSTNALDERNFSRAVPRRLPAEVALDILKQATAADPVNQQFRFELEGRATRVPGTRPVGRDNASGYALSVFGRSTRETTCDCDRSNDPSLLQTVFLYNDRDLHQLMQSNESWVASLKLKPAPMPAARPAARPGSRPTGRPVANPPTVEQLETQLMRVQARLAQLEKQPDSPERQTALNAARRRRNQLQTQLRTRREEQRADAATDMSEAADEVQMSDETQRLAESETMPDLGSAQAEPASANDTPDATSQQRSGLIEQAYLRTLSRLPNDHERQQCDLFLTSATDLAAGMEGLMWTLVNTKEFIINH